MLAWSTAHASVHLTETPIALGWTPYTFDQGFKHHLVHPQEAANAHPLRGRVQPYRGISPSELHAVLSGLDTKTPMLWACHEASAKQPMPIGTYSPKSWTPNHLAGQCLPCMCGHMCGFSSQRICAHTVAYSSNSAFFTVTPSSISRLPFTLDTNLLRRGAPTRRVCTTSHNLEGSHQTSLSATEPCKLGERAN